jgi:RND family efflux transporter MFP subunit
VVDEEDFTGRTDAVTHVDIRCRVTGYLTRVLFEDGSEVKQGDVLFEIDPRPYLAELNRAEAAVKLAEARIRLLEATQKRMEELVPKGAASREDLERTIAERHEAVAALTVAKVTREAAQLNVDFTRVTAPTTGRIGRRLIDTGNLVKADDTLLATIVSRDPIYVYFDIDERTILRLRKLLGERKGADAKLPVEIGLASENGHPHRGVLDFIDNRVNPETGTLRLRALLSNKDGLLLPGMFARVRLLLGEPYKALLVPAQAVMTDGTERFVFVVTDKDVIEKRKVVVGEERDKLRIVREGLRPDDRVVVGHQTEVRPGMKVEPQEGDAKPDEPDRPAAAPRELGRPGPVILVHATYPGANAQVLVDTVAAPIEQQVNGAEGLLALRSRCTNDGHYLLAATFRRGADPTLCQVLVQNRVALAGPTLPNPVNDSGITVRNQAPAVVLLAALLSPDGSRENLYLSNYANIEIKDELERVPGVGRVTLVGHSDYAMRIQIDPDKLAAYDLSAAEVARAIEKENSKGSDTAPLDGKARLAGVEKLSSLVVKTAGGSVVYLRDIARIELGASGPQSQASLDGKPAVLLAIHPTNEARLDKVIAGVRSTLSRLQAKLPKGLDIVIPFDGAKYLEAPERRGASGCLLIDLDLPLSASAERKWDALRRCAAWVRPVAGVQHVVAMSECPFDLFGGGPCLLVLAAPGDKGPSDRAELAQRVRAVLDNVPATKVRTRYLSVAGNFPHFGYPIDFAVQGPEADRIRELADKVTERLGKSKDLQDVEVDTASLPQPQLFIDLDREALAARGMSLQDVFTTFQVAEGGVAVNRFNLYGRTWPVEVHVPGSGDLARDVRKLTVRNGRGALVPLAGVVKVRDVTGASAIDRLDLRPMVEITASPAGKASPGEVRKQVETVVEEVRKELRLPPEYALTWLHSLSWSK